MQKQKRKIEREKLLESLKAMIESDNVKVASNDEIEKEVGVVIVTRVEDFNMESNELWDIDANKSYPRDVYCNGCLSQVVMSNNAFGIFERGGRKQEVICGKCFFGLLKELPKEDQPQT